MNIYLIIGDANTWKSSVVRSLTGLRESKKVELSFIDNTKAIFIFARGWRKFNN